MIKLRRSQTKAYNILKDQPYSILNAPTGWGKSLVLSCLATGGKVIVAVPQKAIAKGFIQDRRIRIPSGDIVNWHVDHDLCGISKAKVLQLRKFLLLPSHAKKTIVTTHHTLAMAWHTLDAEERSTASRNLCLVIDEAHHLQASGLDSNRLGSAIDTIIDADDPSTRLILATAFFFRGDGLPIIHDDKVGKFARHSIPLEEYWQSLKYIKSYNYDFVSFKGSVFPELRKLVKSSQEPTIIYLPREGHRLHLGKSKKDTVAEIVRVMRGSYKGASLWTPGYTGDAAIIDLVTLDDRAEKLTFIAEHGDKVKAILSVGMFKEGADWVEASRVIDLIPSGSDQDRGQRFGRLLRDHPTKSHITYYSFLPYQPDATLEEQREQLSMLFAHFHASLIVTNALTPMRLPSSQVKGKNKDKDPIEDSDYFGSLPSKVQSEILGGCYAELIELANAGPVTAGEARTAIVGVLAACGVPVSHFEGLAKQIVSMMYRRSQHHGSIAGTDLVNAGFDKIWSEEILKDVLVFTAGFGGPQTFAEIRQVAGKVFDSQWEVNFSRIASLTRRPVASDSNYPWIMRVLDLYRSGDLSESRIKQLNTIQWWSWDTMRQDRWQERYDVISRLPSMPDYKSPDFAWIKQQRQMHRDGKLVAERTKQLESISWWSWTVREDTWEERFNKIKELPIRPAHRSEEANWVGHQWVMRKEGKLSAERIKQLESISWWSWSLRDVAWDGRFKRIKALPSAPQSIRGQDLTDYMWVYNQKAQKKKGKLPAERIMRLESIKWWFWD